MPKPQIALFGTSADPPTIGHAAILQYLSQRFDRVAIWAAENPFKVQQTPLAQRHQMLQLLVDDPPEDHPPVADRLQIHPELSHARTWFTLEAARTRWPQAEFTLVVGADLVPQITRWYRANDLLAAVRLLVMPRAGYDLSPADLEPIRALGCRVTIAQVTPPKAASSEYRKQGQRSDNRSANDLTTPTIQAYIEREQLYAWQPNRPQTSPQATAVHR
jgi:nicotinate-nucleotide adenylyltransferase